MLELFGQLVNLADATPLAILSASTTRSRLSGEELGAVAVTLDATRPSVGSRHAEDMPADPNEALAAAPIRIAI